MYNTQHTKNLISINFLNKNLTFLGCDSVFNNGYIGFKNPNTTATTYDCRIYESSTSGSTDYTNGNGLLYFDANKDIFNCAIHSKCYNDTFVVNPPRTQIGNDTKNNTIQYQN